MIETLRLLGEILWPALAAALAAGLFVGLTTCSGSPMGGGGRAAVALALIALATGGAASWFAWLPGQPALWLDIGLGMAVAYVLGCGVGCVVRAALGRALAAAHGKGA